MPGGTINGTRAATAFERVLNALEDRGLDYRGHEPRVNAQCPAHEDDSPSLVITKTNGQTLLWCHTGCTTAEVVTALGMKMSDLFDNRKGIDYHYADGRVVHRRQAGLGERGREGCRRSGLNRRGRGLQPTRR
jgi:hypothetical protein